MSTTSTVRPVLDVVIPVYNEQAGVGPCVRRLTEHLQTTFPYPWRVTIADNASTDATLEVARRIAATDERVRVVHLAAKGRGRALKQVWTASDAHILAYMDVDLSTDLDALWPLVAPLMSGHSDLAIGSRLAPGARVVRGAKREFISRSYNLLLKRHAPSSILITSAGQVLSWFGAASAFVDTKNNLADWTVEEIVHRDLHLAINIGRNVIHGSDAPETASFEIGLWFSAAELNDWTPSDQTWRVED